ncbi:MAG TPA: hypothetical protein VIS71_08825 [Terrimicrobium sp.]
MKGTPRHGTENSEGRATKQLKVANAGSQTFRPIKAYAHGGGEIRLPCMGYNIFYIIGVIVVIAVILKFIGLY